MAKVGTAEYDVEISRAKVQAEVDATSRQIEQGLGRSATKVRDEFSNSARVAVAGFGAFAAANVIGDTISAASDLAEQQSKVGVVFGNSATQVLAFGTSAEQSLGQSERAALEAAGTFGNLFRSVGISERESAKLSVSLTSLASDLASFNNTSVDDALTALRAGLVGETEPLKRYGVNLNEATLKAKALELGLYSGVGALDANAKAQAAYAVIVEQTTLAQGDFERTSDSLANQQRILSAEWENAQAQLGEELIPAAKVAVSVFGDLLKVADALPGPVVAGGVALGGLVVAFGLLGPVVRTGWAELTAFTGANAAAATSAATATGAVNAQTAAMSRFRGVALTAARGAGAIGVGLFALDQIFGQANKARDLSQELDRIANSLANVETAADASKLFGNDIDTSSLGAAIENYDEGSNVLERFANNVAGVNESLGGVEALDNGDIEENKAQVEALDAALVALYNEDPSKAITAYQAVAAALEEQGGAQNDLTNALPGFTDLLLSADEAARQAAVGVEDFAAETLKAKDALREEFDAQRELNDASRDVILAVDELNKAKQDAVTGGQAYADALKEEADAKQAAVDAGRAVVDAQRNEADAVRDVQRAQEDLTEARKRAAETLEDLQFAAEGAVLSEERAQLRLQAAIEEQKRVGRDPGASDRDRQEADLAVREAELALREAQDRKGDSAGDLAEAERQGIEQSDEVVAAKERVEAALQAQIDASEGVRDALDDQREAEDRVREASKKAADVLVDAKGRVEEATRNLEDKILDEAEAQAELAGLTGDATAAHDAYNESIEKSAILLDPNSPFRRNLSDYLEDVRELGTISGLDPAVSPVPGRNPDSGGPSSQPGGIDDLQGNGPRPGRSITNNITVNSNVSPQELADHLAFAQGGN